MTIALLAVVFGAQPVADDDPIRPLLTKYEAEFRKTFREDEVLIRFEKWMRVESPDAEKILPNLRFVSAAWSMRRNPAAKNSLLSIPGGMETTLAIDPKKLAVVAVLPNTGNHEEFGKLLVDGGAILREPADAAGVWNAFCDLHGRGWKSYPAKKVEDGRWRLGLYVYDQVVAGGEGSRSVVTRTHYYEVRTDVNSGRITSWTSHVDTSNPRTVGTEPARADGRRVHTLTSEFQDGTTQVHVLAPTKLEEGRKYPVIYVLPVEPGAQTRWGDALGEVAKLDAANKHGVIFVFPTFSKLPWYADHPTDAKLRQETHLLKAVLPLIESQYPAKAEAAGRLLMGFSKSGWGAFTLLLRNPEVFAKAAAFDAPFAMDWPSKYGSAEIFGTRENFATYGILPLLEKRSGELKGSRRLAVIGTGNFKADHTAVHERMEKLGIEHLFDDRTVRAHAWGSGWIPQAIEFLVK